MASTGDNTSSPLSAQVIRKISPSSSHVVCGENEQVGDGEDGSTFISSPVIPPITSKAVSGRSPLNPSVETPSPRSSAGSDHRGSGTGSDTFPISRGKKPAWKIPSNSAIEVGSVMDAVSWPALTESAKASPKSPSSDSLKALSDGSVSVLQGSSVLSPSKKSPNNQNHISTQNSSSSNDKAVKSLSLATDYRSSNSSISGSSDVGLPLPSSSPKESSQSVHIKQPSLENSPKGLPSQSSGNTDNDRDHKAGRTFQPHGGNGHHRGYGGGRRGNSSNHNSRRDGERGGYEWNHRNFVRDVHMQQQLHQQRGVRPYLRPSAVAGAPFISPPPLRPFSNHMAFPDFPSPIYYIAAPSHPDSLRGVPFAPLPAHAPQMMLFPASDPQRAMLLKQIDYYFSPDNLCKDIFLRQNMDDQGWVPISVIADFNRVKQMTNSIQYLVDTLQLSSVVEVQGDKIRKRNDWMAWVLHPTEDFDSLETHFDKLYLDLDAPMNAGFRGSTQKEATYSRSASMNLNSPLSVRNLEDDDGQVGNYSDRVWSMRTLVRNDTM